MHNISKRRTLDEEIFSYFTKNYDKPMDFDNTGILIPLPFIDYSEFTEEEYKKIREAEKEKEIILTIDLTRKVLKEHEKSIFISYHPFLFNKINRIDRNLKKIISENCIISPHTMLAKK